MAKIFKYSGWLAAIILLGFCVVLTLKLVGVERALIASEDARSALLNSPEEDEARRVLEAQLADAEEALEETRQQLAVASTQAPSPVPEEVAETKASEAPTPDETPDAAMPEPAEAGESRGERVARAQVGAMVDMIYGDLVAELGLSPELAATFKEALAESMQKQQQTVQGALKAKDRSAKAVRAQRDALREALRGELATVLGPNELAAYDEYELVADQILYEKMVDGQLNMLASGLSNDNRVLTSQVVAEELVREFDLLDQSDVLYTLDNFNAAQTRALTMSRDRLGATLPEDQLALVSGFVDQALAMFDAMSDKTQ